MVFCYFAGENFGLSPTNHFRPSSIYTDTPDLQRDEITTPSKPRNFTHPICEHVGRCTSCGCLQPHENSIVVSVDGACRGNGTGLANTVSAIGMFFGKDSVYNRGRVLGANVKTNQVAELYAGIEALRMVQGLMRNSGQARAVDRQFADLHLEQLVVKSDSEYLVKGMTEWIAKWEWNGWKTSKGLPVVNEVLFRELRACVRDLAGLGVEVMFWHVRRDENSEADRLANEALDGK